MFILHPEHTLALLTSSARVHPLPQQIQESNIQLLVPDEDDLTQLRGEVIGPPDTPYAGGRYQLDIAIPESYPFSPPRVRLSPGGGVAALLCFSLLEMGSLF